MPQSILKWQDSRTESFLNMTDLSWDDDYHALHYYFVLFLILTCSIKINQEQKLAPKPASSLMTWSQDQRFLFKLLCSPHLPAVPTATQPFLLSPSISFCLFSGHSPEIKRLFTIRSAIRVITTSPLTSNRLVKLPALQVNVTISKPMTVWMRHINHSGTA